MPTSVPLCRTERGSENFDVETRACMQTEGLHAGGRNLKIGVFMSLYM